MWDAMTRPALAGIRAAVVMLLLAALPVSPAAGQSISHPRDAAAIFAQATASGDVDALAALYAPGARLLPPDGADAAGREAIRAVYARNQALGPNSVHFHEVAGEEAADSATMYWVWTLTIAPAGREAIEINGRSMLYWKRFESGWQIVLDMFQVMPPGH